MMERDGERTKFSNPFHLSELKDIWVRAKSKMSAWRCGVLADRPSRAGQGHLFPIPRCPVAMGKKRLLLWLVDFKGKPFPTKREKGTGQLGILSVLYPTPSSRGDMEKPKTVG